MKPAARMILLASRDKDDREHYPMDLSYMDERRMPRRNIDRDMPERHYPGSVGTPARYNYPNRIGYEYQQPHDDMDEAEMRRRRDRRGRFRSDAEPEMHYPYHYPPPIYEDAPNPIGFAAESSELPGKFHMIRGGAAHHEMKLDKEMADKWMENLQNEDGTKGPHWTMEQTSQVIRQKNLSCDPLEFWVALNAVYSDYCVVAKKSNVNNLDFYVNMAKAFIDDKDSQPDRLARYYTYIVKH